MTNHNFDQTNRQEIQSQTAKAMNRQLGSAYPLTTPALIASIPTTIAGYLLQDHLSKRAVFIIVMAIYFAVTTVMHYWFRSFLRKHPELKWRIFIR